MSSSDAQPHCVWAETQMCKLVSQKFISYQAICGATFADAHLLINRFKVIIQLQILQASFEWLQRDVISVGGKEVAGDLVN